MRLWTLCLLVTALALQVAAADNVGSRLIQRTMIHSQGMRQQMQGFSTRDVDTPPTPGRFYHGDNIAIRFTRPEQNSELLGESAMSFVYILDDLVKKASSDRAWMDDHYPVSPFRTDFAGFVLMLRNSDARNWFLTYENIVEVVADLMGAAVELSSSRLYDGPFEVWTPANEPDTKVLDGYWSSRDQEAQTTNASPLQEWEASFANATVL